MTAKNARARHRRFLSAGFFPPEVPPCFYSERLARYRNSLNTEFSKIKKVKGEPDYHYYRSHKFSFNFPRFNNVDRRHSIINPISYFYISKTLADKFVELRSQCKKSTLSVSPSIFDWSGERTLKRPVFESREAFLTQLHARYEYVLNTDIRAFFHSMYTHTIAWAIHGKATAKKNRSSKFVGNLLDLLCRNSQDGQTVGLPVGPDTSRMIAEIVGSAIDLEIQKKLKSSHGAMRFIDDFSFGCNTREHAEKMVALVRRAVNDFELDTSNEKTAIERASQEYLSGWKVHVRSFIPKRPYSEEDFELFFYHLDKVARENPNINVEKFVIQNARRAFLESDDAWKKLEHFILALYRRNATVISNVVETLVLRNMLKSDLSLSQISDFIHSRLPTLHEQRKGGEAAWLLFMTASLKIEIKARSLDGFFDEDDPLCAILIADLDRNDLVKGAVNYSQWNKSLNGDGLDGSYVVVLLRVRTEIAKWDK